MFNFLVNKSLFSTLPGASKRRKKSNNIQTAPKTKKISTARGRLDVKNLHIYIYIYILHKVALFFSHTHKHTHTHNTMLLAFVTNAGNQETIHSGFSKTNPATIQKYRTAAVGELRAREKEIRPAKRFPPSDHGSFFGAWLLFSCPPLLPVPFRCTPLVPPRFVLALFQKNVFATALAVDTTMRGIETPRTIQHATRDVS